LYTPPQHSETLHLIRICNQDWPCSAASIQIYSGLVRPTLFLSATHTPQVPQHLLLLPASASSTIILAMSFRDTFTSPSSSPYQPAMKPTSMLHSPAYPSPARSDCEPSRYPAEGLGLHAFSQAFPTSRPSPQPTEAWTQLSTGASPLITELHVNPWTTTYEHATSRSPLSWAPQRSSHRSSLSPARDMSVFSHDGSEHTFPQIEHESRSDWGTDEEALGPKSQRLFPMAVSPERLTAGLFSYDQAYRSPAMSSFGTPSLDGYDSREFESISYEGHLHDSPQAKDNLIVPTARTRARRNPTTPENANYSCHVCKKLFQRSYNHKTHMETHNPNRKKEHLCPHKDCDKLFVRKTDLERHRNSVHKKSKPWSCRRCDNSFSRKDTLRRLVTLLKFICCSC
jgi:hypothetical protein